MKLSSLQYAIDYFKEAIKESDDLIKQKERYIEMYRNEISELKTEMKTFEAMIEELEKSRHDGKITLF
jgi:chromosome segregation ATPase